MQIVNPSAILISLNPWWSITITSTSAGTDDPWISDVQAQIMQLIDRWSLTNCDDDEGVAAGSQAGVGGRHNRPQARAAQEQNEVVLHLQPRLSDSLKANPTSIYQLAK